MRIFGISVAGSLEADKSYKLVSFGRQSEAIKASTKIGAARR